MTIPVLLEWFAAVLLIVTGVSHILHPKLWADLFIDLMNKPYAGFVIGIATLPLGLPIAIGTTSGRGTRA